MMIRIPEILPVKSDLIFRRLFADERNKEELTMIAERNPHIEKAVVKLRHLSSDEQTRDMYERREKARRDEESIKRWAQEEGMREGRQEGMREGMIAVAKTLLSIGDPIDKIIKVTGFTSEEIYALKNSL
jgi:predicted transposase/invertase (TIGR01784 family)